LAKLKLCVQGAWSDSKTNTFNLTQARELTLPGSAPRPLPKRSAIYYYNTTNTTGNGPYSTYYYNPCFAYTYK
jgi:hypothetical protein